MIHKTSIIEDGAKIADDVIIGPFCYVGKDVELMSGCILESNIILKGKLKACPEVRIFSFSVIGNDNSDIEIGTKTYIREFSQIGTQEPIDSEYKKIIIGANSFLMSYVQISNGVELSDWCIITNSVVLLEDVKCEERVIIGGLSTIEAGVTLGTGVMIGGASCVNQDMPPFTLVEGNKASVKGLNIVGLRRRVKNKDDLEEVKSVFKQILKGDINQEMSAKIAKEHENEYVRCFAQYYSKKLLD